MGGGRPGGGSLTLAELIDEHGAALVSDFQSFYGLRLAEVVDVWSPREVLALVEGLPDDGMFAARLAGGEKWREFIGWGKRQHQFADLWDVIAANVMKGSKKKPPTYPRPNTSEPEEMTMRDFLRTAKNL